MIYNATLLRLDPPGGDPAGADLSVRCAMTPLGVEQSRVSREEGWDAVVVLYIPMSRVPSPRPVTNGAAVVRADGETGGTTYRISEVIQRLAHTLSHTQLFLALEA
jgi:hypothetical protein